MRNYQVLWAGRGTLPSRQGRGGPIFFGVRFSAPCVVVLCSGAIIAGRSASSIVAGVALFVIACGGVRLLCPPPTPAPLADPVDPCDAPDAGVDLPSDDDPELAVLAALHDAECHLAMARAMSLDAAQGSLDHPLAALAADLDAFSLSGEPFGDLAAAWALEARARHCCTIAIAVHRDETA